MELGFLLDRGYPTNQAGKWVEGAPERSAWIEGAVKEPAKRKTKEIVTYRWGQANT